MGECGVKCGGKVEKKDITSYNSLKMEMDKINVLKDKLYQELVFYLYKKGPEFVNSNYYKIESFINVILSKDFLSFLFKIKNKNPSHISQLVYEFRIKANIPSSFYLAMVHYASSSNIIEAFNVFISPSSKFSRQFGKDIIDSPQYKTQVAREVDIGYKTKFLVIRIFRNTSISSLVDFLNQNSKMLNKLKLDILTNYPHSKKGKIDYYQKIKEYVSQIEKKEARIENKKLDEQSSELKPDTDKELAGLMLGNKYYSLKNAKKGENILRTRRKRLHKKLNRI